MFLQRTSTRTFADAYDNASAVACVEMRKFLPPPRVQDDRTRQASGRWHHVQAQGLWCRCGSTLDSEEHAPCVELAQTRTGGLDDRGVLAL